MKQVLVYLDTHVGAAVVCEANEEAREDAGMYGSDWADWPADLGLYEKGAGLYVIDSADDFETGNIRTLTTTERERILLNEPFYES